MRVLFVLEYFPPHIGGAETLFEQLTENLSRKKHEITVVTTWLPGTLDFEKKGGREIYRVKTPSFGRRFWFTFLSLPTIIKLGKKADILHTTTYNAALPTWVAGKILKKKILLHVLEVFGHQWFFLGEKNPLFPLFFYLYEKLLFALPFDHYIAISQFTARNLGKIYSVPSEKITVVYPWVDYQLWNRKKYLRHLFRQKLRIKDNFLFLFYGRPGISKGLECLVKAYAHLKQKFGSTKLLLILSKDPESQFQRILRLINNFGLGEEIIILPTQEREVLPGFIKAADCVVIPSLSEGFGFSAIESGLVGVPVLATNAGSLPEIISGKYLLVKPGSITDLSRGMRKMIEGEYIVSKRKIFARNKSLAEVEMTYSRLIAGDKIRLLRKEILQNTKRENLDFGMEGLFHLQSNLVWERFLERVSFLAKEMPVGARVLDLGCGLGQTACLLRIMRPDIEVFAADLHPPKVWEYLKKYGCIFQRENALHLSFKKNSFDVVFSFGVMEHIENDEKFLQEIYRILKPAGKCCIFHLPNKLSYSETIAALFSLWHHPKKYSHLEIERKLIKAGFSQIDVKRCDFIPGQLGRISGLLGQIQNWTLCFWRALDKFCLATPLSSFAQNFSVTAIKEKK